MLQNLSPELQLLVIAELHSIEIARLQQTCRHFRDLVEAFSRTIWKHRLRRQAFESDVFWPTYKDLKDASEFRNAATAATRFSKAHAGAVRCSESLTATRRSLRLPMNGDNFRDIYLVQGGRFIIIFGENRVTLWEIAPPTEENLQELKLEKSFSKEVDHLEQVLATNVVDNQKIRALISLGPYDPTKATYQVLEISFSEIEGAFTVTASDRLVTALDPTAVESLQLVDNAVILHDEDHHITIFWDFALNKYASWKHGGISPILGVFADNAYTHVFYAAPEGVIADQIPPLRSIVNGETIVAAESSAVATKTYSWAHKEAYRLDAQNPTPNFVGPETMVKVTPAERHSSLFFQVRETIRSKEVVQLRTFEVVFNPANPSQSRLQPTEGTRLHYPDESELQPVFRRPCEGSLATLWIDTNSHITRHFLSIAPPVEASGPDVPPQKVLALVPFEPRLEFQPMPWEWEPFYEFDPVSGKVLILHGFLSGEPSIELYDFL